MNFGGNSHSSPGSRGGSGDIATEFSFGLLWSFASLGSGRFSAGAGFLGEVGFDGSSPSFLSDTPLFFFTSILLETESDKLLFFFTLFLFESKGLVRSLFRSFGEFSVKGALRSSLPLLCFACFDMIFFSSALGFAMGASFDEGLFLSSCTTIFFPLLESSSSSLQLKMPRRHKYFSAFVDPDCFAIFNGLIILMDLYAFNAFFAVGMLALAERPV